MATQKTKKPRVDNTRKVRADRRKALLDVAARRMGMLDWGALQRWARESVEMPNTDQGVNNQLKHMLHALADNIVSGDPIAPPADVLRVFSLYPVGPQGEDAGDEAGLSDKTRERIAAGMEKYSDEAGRLAVRPKASEVFGGDE